MGSLPHVSIHNLSKQYGPIMQLRFGSVPVVVGSSVETAEIFLKTMDLNFVGRPSNAARKYTNYNYSDIIWSPGGPVLARKICLTELFSNRRIESYEHIRVEEMKSLLRETFRSSGKAFPLRDGLFNLSLNVISRMVMGKRYMIESTEGYVKEMVEEWFLLNGVLNIGDYVPWLSFMDLQGYVKRMKKVGKNFDRFLEHVLDEHVERRNVTNGEDGDHGIVKTKDMVDVLLDLANDPSSEVKLERNGIKAFTLDLIVGGTESSAITVEWAISELLKKPKLFEKATEELDRVIGSTRWVEERDMSNLPYIEAIIKETMRLHPVAPMLSPRMSLEDCKVNGYDIKAGTRIFVNIWTIGRDPKIWEDPDMFRPERFLGKDIDVKGQNFALLPFGSGRRMCPGYNLGLKVIQSSLANILHGFKWKLPNEMGLEDLNMEESFGITTPKKFPLVVVAEPRLPLHLYEL